MYIMEKNQKNLSSEDTVTMDLDLIQPSSTSSFTFLKEEIISLLSTLTDTEQNVMRLRFGLDDNQSKNPEEIGEILGMTSEDVKQIEIEVLNKFRHPSRSKRAKGFID